MIVEFILGAFKGVIEFLFGWLPGLPSMSSEAFTGIDSFLGLIPGVVGVISYLYTPTIFIFIFSIIVALLIFDPAYAFFRWVWHKVRG